MSEERNRSAANVGPEAYDNDARPPKPLDDYWKSTLPDDLRKRMEEGAKQKGRGADD